jgi:hypothetical protein
MTWDAIEPLLVLVSMGVAMACARAWMARTADLKLSLFRPYRGDPWPLGVQEDDDFRFNWSAAAGTGSAIAGPPADHGAIRGLEDASGEDATYRDLIEAIPGGSVSVERVGGISVRHVRG